MRGLALLVFMLGCGGKPKAPIDQSPPHATDEVPGTAGGNAVHLSCKGLSTVNCQTTDFHFQATYDQPTDCRHGGDDAMHATWGSTTDTTAKLGIHFASYGGPGKYDLNSDTNYFELAASVPRGCPEAKTTAGLLAPKETCGACTVTITDPNPSAAFPKPLEFAVSCPAMCEANAWKCGGVNMKLTSAPCPD